MVLCFLNGVDIVGKAIEHLAAQDDGQDASGATVPLPFWELVLINDGSTDGADVLVRELLTSVEFARPDALTGITFVNCPVNSGIAAARTAGVSATRAPLLTYCDYDCAPHEGYLASLFAAWSRVGPEVVGVGGTTEALAVDTLARAYAHTHNPLAPLELGVDSSASLSARIRRRLFPLPPSQLPLRPMASLVGASMSFRRSALEVVGPFDPVMRFAGEEEDLCERLRQRFGPTCLVMDTSVVMHHDFHPSVQDALRRAFAYGRGGGRNFARRGGIPTLAPLPIVCSAALLAGALARRPGLGAAAAASALALYCRDDVKAVPSEPVRALFVPLTLALESANLAGFVSGMWAQRRAWRVERSR